MPKPNVNHNPNEPKKIAALFDCDGTLVSAQFGRGLIEYAKEIGHMDTVRKYYSSIAGFYVLRRLRILPREFFLRKIIANLAWFFNDMDESEAQKCFDWVVHEYLLPSTYEEVVARLSNHQSQGHITLLVSSQFIPTLDILGSHFKTDGFIGTQLEMGEGTYTGAIVPPVITGKHKSQGVIKYFEDKNVNIDWSGSFAYADSMTDMDLLKLVGNPVAVYPERLLHQIAQKNNWEMIGEPKE